MKPYRKPFLPRIVIANALIAICLAAGGAVPSASAQPVESRRPAQMRSEFDNPAMLVLRIRLAPGAVPEAFVVTGIVAVYLLAIGNLSSVHFPRAMNPERVSQGGSASRLQALIFLFYPFALLPVFLAFWARQVFGSELIFSIILTFAALLGVVIYWIAMESAVRAVVQRREKILMELSGSEGPVATE